MRFLLLLAVLLGCACKDPPKRAAAPEGKRVEGVKEVDAAPKVAVPPDAAVGDFADATGPVDGLWVGMTVEEARAFLTQAAIEFTESSPNAKRPHYISTVLDGWKATLYFDEGYDFIAGILLQSRTFTDEAEADAVVDRLVARYGPPTSQRDTKATDGTWLGNHRTWQNDRTSLELDLQSDGSTEWTFFAGWTR